MSSLQGQTSRLQEPLNRTNHIEFYSQQAIQPNHIDILIMCLESPKLSGGGTITNYSIDERMQTLSIEYDEQEVRDRVLATRSLEIHGYRLTVVEPMERDDESSITHDLDKNLLILKNVPDLANYVVDAYAESLVIKSTGDNAIAASHRSQYFMDIYYVRFTAEIDLAYCRERLKRRPTLDGKEISIQYGFSTDTLYFKISPELRNRTNVDSIAAYFGNKKKFQVNPLVLIKLHEPFYLMKFNSNQSMTAFLMDNTKGGLDTLKLRKLSIGGGGAAGANLFENIIFENLFDVRILDGELFQRQGTEPCAIQPRVLSILSDPGSIASDEFRYFNENNILRRVVDKSKSVVDNIPSNVNISRNFNKIKGLFKKT